MKPFGLDALLGSWPAQDPQEKGGPSWDERAEAIVKASVALKDRASAEVLGALVAPPLLDAEPGEEKAASFEFGAPREERVVPSKSQIAGESQPMSNDSSPPKKASLKELAARASQAGAARGSIPPTGRASTPSPATVTPITKAKGARLSDPGREDSGVLRLADLQANETAKAEAAKAAAEAKASEKAPVVAAASAAAPVQAKPAAAAASGGSSSTGMWAGVAIAVLGIAAAFAVYRAKQPDPAPPKVAVVDTTAKPQGAAVGELPKPKAEPTAVASSEAAPAATEAPKADENKGAAGATAATATAVAGNDVKPAQATTAAPKGSKVGSLDEEMKKAVGANESQPAPQDDSKPASGGGGNVPEQPSQGNAQAAVRAVVPAARACVAGAPEPTSASITFGSSGAVQSVSVTGWAAANGKAACVKSALQGAHVSPFAKPTFTASATIRP